MLTLCETNPQMTEVFIDFLVAVKSTTVTCTRQVLRLNTSGETNGYETANNREW